MMQYCGKEARLTRVELGKEERREGRTEKEKRREYDKEE